MQTELTTTINARVPQNLKDAIQAEANNRLLSESDIIREALQSYFQRQEAKAGANHAEDN